MQARRAVARGFWIVTALACAFACAAPASPPPPAPRELTITMHPLTSGRIAKALIQVMAASTPRLIVRVHEVERGVDQVSSVQTGSADCAFVYADLAYLSYVGQVGHASGHLRGVAVLTANPVYLVVRRASRVRDVFDLRGRSVSLGLSGGTTALTVPVFLDALDIPATLSYESFPDAIERLVAGSLDAIFAVGSYPLEPLQAALPRGLRVVSLPQATVDRVHREHPFLRPVVLPRGMYNEAATLTIGVDRLLICRDGLDADTVYQFTKTFMAALPQLSQLDKPLQQMNVEEAQSTLLPLHEGAARYYREQD
jgi:TRAP transporter TAXI family solute receptor